MISNNLKTQTSKQKISNTVIAFTIFLAVVFYFIMLPFIKSVYDLKAEILNEKINIEKKRDIEKNAIILSKKIAKTESDINNLENVFIKKNQELEFITTLENIASKNNITQKINLTPQSDSEKNSKTKKTAKAVSKTTHSTLNITASGNYSDAMNYIREINSQDYYININTLELYKSSDNESLPENRTIGNRIINFNIIAETYWN